MTHELNHAAIPRPVIYRCLNVQQENRKAYGTADKALLALYLQDVDSTQLKLKLKLNSKSTQSQPKLQPHLV